MSGEKAQQEKHAGPRMELRFKHVSLSADLAVVPTKEDKLKDPRDELPTLTNQIIKHVVAASAKKFSVRKHILRDVTGSFRPGTVTLLLGQSGAGKSALMKLLSGRFPMGKEITLAGEMLYNNVATDQLKKRLPQFVNYVTQCDTHMPTMTVRETLAFAYECCTARGSSGSSSKDKAMTMDAVANANQKTPSAVLQMFGLDNCQNTIMGNHMVRGTSGGEKKRTTTGEMEFGMKFVTLMDEITTGLDSAAAFDVIAAQRDLARRQNKTVVISLLQPSPEIFSLFDDVLLLSEGRVLYFGPTSEVQGYFETLGLVCPPQRDVADFLCDLSTPQQVQYEKAKPNFEAFSLQGRNTRPRSAGDYADIWVSSPLYENQEAEAEAREALENSVDTKMYMDGVPEFQQSFVESTWTLMKRQVILTRRNTAFLLGRIGLVTVVGLLFGSLFFNMNMTKAQITMSLVFAAVLFLGLGQSALLVIYFDARAVFYKQRAANFYRTISYVLATSMVQVPVAVVETLLFGSLTYWMSGFVADVPSFFVFELFLLLIIMVFSGVFFFLSAAMPNLHIAEPVAMVALLFFVMFAGFIVSKDQIPDWLMWMYWADPVSWAVRGIAVSQYRSSEFDVCVYDGMNYCMVFNKTLGEYSLGLFDVPADTKWVNYGIIFLAGAYAASMILSYLALEYHRYERPEHIALPKDDEGEDDGFKLLDSPHSTTNLALLNAEQQQVKATNVEVSVQGVSRYERVPPVTVAFKDLWYTVTVPGGKGQSAHDVDLLKGITGYAMPGSLTALMGSTGAGKTTLMDVIAGRKTAGTIKGEILLNGFPATDLSVRRCTGYCEQTDIHSSSSTFREALTFSAFLRQGSNVSDSDKLDTWPSVWSSWHLTTSPIASSVAARWRR
jgi:ABC-type multidrug transport system ATPase subunit